MHGVSMSADEKPASQSLFGASIEDPAHRWKADPVGAFTDWQKSRLLGAGGTTSFNERSTRQYVAMFSRFCKWLAGEGGDITRVTAEEIARFLGTVGRGDEKAAISTVRRYLSLLSKVIVHLNEQGARTVPKDGAKNPAQDLLTHSYKYVEPPAPVYLSRVASERFIQWVANQPIRGWVDVRDKALRSVFLAAGLAVDEARRLRLSEIGVENGKVVHLHIAPHHYGQHARVVPLASWACDSMTDWYGLRKAMFVSSDAFFLARSKDFKVQEPGVDAVGSTEIFTIVQTAMQAIGHTSERQGPQTLRHTFTARQLYLGIPRWRIAEWLGLQSTDGVDVVAKQIKDLQDFSPG